jgi:hypothetical protein
MAKSLQQAAANYDRAKQFMPQAYAAAQGRATSNWSKGVADFLGRAPRSDRAQKYAAGYDPAAYSAAISRTSGAAWAAAMQEKM